MLPSHSARAMRVVAAFIELSNQIIIRVIIFFKTNSITIIFRFTERTRVWILSLWYKYVHCLTVAQRQIVSKRFPSVNPRLLNK